MHTCIMSLHLKLYFLNFALPSSAIIPMLYPCGKTLIKLSIKQPVILCLIFNCYVSTDEYNEVKLANGNNLLILCLTTNLLLY